MLYLSFSLKDETGTVPYAQVDEDICKNVLKVEPGFDKWGGGEYDWVETLYFLLTVIGMDVEDLKQKVFEPSNDYIRRNVVKHREIYQHLFNRYDIHVTH